MLGRVDGQHRPGEAGAEPVQGSLALNVAQGGGGADIEAELNPRVRGVHTLAAGPGGVGEPLEQLCRRHRDPGRCARPWGYAQVIHAGQYDPRGSPGAAR